MFSYNTGRFGKKYNLKDKIKFLTVVRVVEFDEAKDVFHVTVADLKSGAIKHEDFTHVIVASGIWSYQSRL